MIASWVAQVSFIKRIGRFKLLGYTLNVIHPTIRVLVLYVTLTSNGERGDLCKEANEEPPKKRTYSSGTECVCVIAPLFYRSGRVVRIV